MLEPMTRFLRVALACAFLATLPATTASAQSDEERAQAREHFSTGVQRFESSDFQGALEAFQEAYRLAPHPMVRVNMANCYEHLERPIEAIHHFEQFLAESEGASRQQRREVDAAMRRLRQQVAEVRLVIAPDGALVTIDGAETRRAPILSPILMNTGHHRFEVRMDGFRSAREEIELAGGEARTLSIRLDRGQDEPEAPAVAAVEPGATEADATTEGEVEATADEPEEIVAIDEGRGWEFRMTTPVIIGGAATAGLLLGAVVTGPLALSYNAEFENAVERVRTATTLEEQSQARRDGNSAASTADALSIVTDVLVVGTIAAAAVTTFFVIVDGLDAGEDEESLEVALVPSAGPGGGGLVLQGAF